MLDGTQQSVITSVVEGAAEPIQEADIDQSLKEAAKAAIFADVVQDQDNDFPNTAAGRIVHNQLFVMTGRRDDPVNHQAVSAVSPAVKLSAKIQAVDMSYLLKNNALLLELFPTLDQLQIDQLREADVLESLIVLRKIFLHPYPQNRNEGASTSPRPGILALKPGYEIQGMLGLTKFNLDVTRQETIDYFTQEVNRVMSVALNVHDDPKIVLYNKLVTLATEKEIKNPEQMVAKIPAELRELVLENKIPIEEIAAIMRPGNNEIYQYVSAASLIKDNVISFQDFKKLPSDQRESVVEYAANPALKVNMISLQDYQEFSLDQRKSALEYVRNPILKESMISLQDYQKFSTDQKVSALRYASNPELKEKYKSVQDYIIIPSWRSELIDECKLTDAQIAMLRPNEYAPVAVLIKNKIMTFTEYQSLSASRKKSLIKFTKNPSAIAIVARMNSVPEYLSYSPVIKTLFAESILDPSVHASEIAFAEYIISAPLEVPNDISINILSERLGIFLRLIQTQPQKSPIQRFQQIFYNAAIQACRNGILPTALFENEDFIKTLGDNFDPKSEDHLAFLLKVLPPNYLQLHKKLLIISMTREILRSAQAAGIQNPQQFVDSMPQGILYMIGGAQISLNEYLQILQQYKNLPQEYDQFSQATQHQVMNYLRHPEGLFQDYILSKQSNDTDFSQDPMLVNILLTSKAMDKLSHQQMINLFNYICIPDVKSNLQLLPRNNSNPISWSSFKYKENSRWAEGIENMKAGLMYGALFDDTGKRRPPSVIQDRLKQIYQNPALKQILDTHTGLAFGQTDASKDIGQLINEHQVGEVNKIIDQIAQRLSRP